ncbi:MAG TPA: EamA family transporter [Clostridiales bacterium]|nr:EamA family transporter [Clostridiales bacterium]
MNSKAIGFILAAISGIAWGTYGTFVSFLAKLGYTDTTIAAFAPIMLIVFFLISLLLRNPKGIIPTKKSLLVFIVTGVVGVLGTNVCYVMALSAGLSLGIASVITFSNYFLVMVFSRIIWKVKITKVKIIAGIAAVIGIFLVLEAWAGLAISPLGLVLIFVVMLTFAFSYTLCNYALNDLGTDPDAFYFYINIIGLIGMLILSPPTAIFGEISASVGTYGFISILAILGFGLIPQLLSYFCLGRAFLHIDPPSVVIMYGLDPVVATVLGFLLFGQSLNLIQLLGMAVVIAALICLQLAERREIYRTEDSVAETGETPLKTT